MPSSLPTTYGKAYGRKLNSPTIVIPIRGRKLNLVLRAHACLQAGSRRAACDLYGAALPAVRLYRYAACMQLIDTAARGPYDLPSTNTIFRNIFS